MKQKRLRLGTALLALLTLGTMLAGCGSREPDLKAAHANEDASAKQARADKKPSNY